MNKPAIPRGLLVRAPPPSDLAQQVLAFVHRDEDPGPQLVRVLPELRPSIQIMSAERYWLRSAADGAVWRCLPRIALWGPRYHWCYGYAAGHIRAFGVALSATALRSLAGGPAARHVNAVLDVEAFHPALAEALTPDELEPFDAWRARATAALVSFFAAAPKITDPIAPTLTVLATAEANGVARAAADAGLSERQYRRVFARLYGVAPKLYQRALRVDRMLRQLHDAPWEPDAFRETPIAFADQPHAIREFRSLTGLTPRAYVRTKRDGGVTLRSAPTNEIEPPDINDQTD